jgi:hypothetical protein
MTPTTNGMTKNVESVYSSKVFNNYKLVAYCQNNNKEIQMPSPLTKWGRPGSNLINFAD